MKLATITVAIAATFMAGCASVTTQSLRDHPNLTNDELCRQVGHMRSREPRMPDTIAAIDLAIERKAIDGNKRQSIIDQDIGVGMSKCEVLASWGVPDRTNSRTSPRGTTEGWWYGVLGRYSKRQLVWFDQTGRVYSISD